MSQELITNDNSNPQQGTGESGDPNVNLNSDTAQPLPGLSNASSKIPPTRKDARKLFVGGLPADVTDDEFRTFFEQFGQVVDSVVMFDRETHRSRGFGFVTFVDPEVAKSLLRIGNHKDGTGRLVMRGKSCEVKAAEPKDPVQRPNNRNRNAFGTSDHQGAMFVGGPRPMHFHPNFVPPPPPGASFGNTIPPSHGYAPGFGYPGYSMPMYYPVYPTFHDVPLVPFPGYGGMPHGHAHGHGIDGTIAFQHHSIPPVPLQHPPNNYFDFHGASHQMSVMQPVAPGIPPKELSSEAGESSSPPSVPE